MWTRVHIRKVAMAWIWLMLAGALEVAWSQSIKPTENFTRLGPTLLCLGLATAAV